MITQNNNPKGFSLVELLMSLIVISSIAAAFAPVITKKLSNNNITVGSFGGGNSGSGGGASLECSGISDCILCKDNICYTCIKDKETCPTGTYLDNPSCSCKACSNIISGCASCTKGGVCTSSRACRAFGENCIQCNVAECEQCRTGYNLNEQKNLCLPDKVDCNDENCTSCSTAEKCDVCNGGYDVEDGGCIRAKLVDYTFVDSSGNNIKTTATALVQSGNEWKIKITKSGTIKFTKLYSLVDVFVVGAGGRGNVGGGGGGYTKTELNVVLDLNTNYSITVGQPNGGTSSGFGLWAKGGVSGGGVGVNYGGGGGSGGSGWGSCGNGSDGRNGGSANASGAIGQGTTTREFEEEANGTFAGEAKGKLYSSGGRSNSCAASVGGANSGDGGSQGNGGSGVVIVRGYGPLDENNEICKIKNCQICVEGNKFACKRCNKGYTVSNNSCVVSAPVKYNYSGNSKTTSTILSMDGAKWKIKFTQSGTFTPTYISGIGSIDVFTVGGGGKGVVGGGGGGYTTTGKSTLYKNNAYSITVGGSGGTSSGFGINAYGGNNACGENGNNGGSGGSGGSGWASGVIAKDGSSGGSANASGGGGQGRTTREFGDSTGRLYSRGGGSSNYGPTEGDYNTGNGGARTVGGSGIVIIRGEY